HPDCRADLSQIVALQGSVCCMYLGGGTVRLSRPAFIVQRHLAAIFSADVAGYTRLMSADEVGTLRLLASHREMTDRLIPQHGGRIANTAGDGILAEFPSAVDALRCSLDIQEKVANVNAEVPDERRVVFRIGIHVGEAMIRNGDLFGDGVNIAARMQTLAEPGLVCLSATAHEYVCRIFPVHFEDLGPQRVKNLDTPVHAYIARPAGPPSLYSIPPIHRNNEANLVRRCHTIFRDALTEVSRREGLEPIEFAILASLGDAPGISQRVLAKRVGIDAGTARRMIKRLERHGLVQQLSKLDRRNALGLMLTQSGAELYPRLRPAMDGVLDRAMAPLSDHERESLRDLLARIIMANEARGENGRARDD
ncbi:adenylate/guanylate cyclase domain-containing protein, partial [Sinorhizobium fredii]